jgi:hypothetical protein
MAKGRIFPLGFGPSAPEHISYRARETIAAVIEVGAPEDTVCDWKGGFGAPEDTVCDWKGGFGAPEDTVRD